jgi:hypothetical protein
VKGCPLSANCLLEAIGKRHHEVCMWLMDHDVPMCVQSADMAFRSGDVELLRRLEAAGCPWGQWNNPAVLRMLEPTVKMSVPNKDGGCPEPSSGLKI